MGCYDIVLVPCPECGTIEEAQSKGGDCLLLDYYKLPDCPDDVLSDVNQCAPFTCRQCGTVFEVMDRRPVFLLETALVDGKTCYLSPGIIARYNGKQEEPILVVKRQDGRYSVMEGHLQLAVYKMQKCQYIAALVVGRVRDG